MYISGSLDLKMKSFPCWVSTAISETVFSFVYSKRRGNQRLCICNVIVIIRVRKNKGGVSYELLWWLVKGRDGKREQWKG